MDNSRDDGNNNNDNNNNNTNNNNKKSRKKATTNKSHDYNNDEDDDDEETITFNLTPKSKAKARTRPLNSSFPEGLEVELVLSSTNSILRPVINSVRGVGGGYSTSTTTTSASRFNSYSGNYHSHRDEERFALRILRILTLLADRACDNIVDNFVYPESMKQIYG